MPLKILFRRNRDTEKEFGSAVHVLGANTVVDSRVLIETDDVVIGRYSVLPFYEEVVRDVKLSGGKLIHSASQHHWIADMSWEEPLRDLTPTTYFDSGWANIPDSEHGWVVKGRTNSLKFKWNSHMRAPTREDLKQVLSRCHSDSLLGTQGLVIREYEHLVEFEEGINGMPVTNEWRVFFYKNRVIQASYYWAQAEHLPSQIPKEALDFAQKAAEKVTPFVDFFVIDVGQKSSDLTWTVIEVNSGQMSGLSTGSPEEFYTNLYEAVKGDL